MTTAEYGSQMLSIGGVRHLTGGSKKEGRVTCDTLLKLCAGEAVTLTIDGGHEVVVEAGKAPVVDGRPEERMRVGCGSATVGIFARQWLGHVDEVIVLDDHITGVLTEHQAGRVLEMPHAGIRVRGRKSTPGRYFQVANPGLGWGGTDISDPLSVIQAIDPATAWPGLRLLLTSTTGEDALYCVLDEALKPVPAEMPEAVRRGGRADRRELRALALHCALHGGRRRVAPGRASPTTRCCSPAPCGRARRASPWAGRRSMSGPAAGSP